MVSLGTGVGQDTLLKGHSQKSQHCQSVGSQRPPLGKGSRKGPWDTDRQNKKVLRKEDNTGEKLSWPSALLYKHEV